jgi:TolB-like protein/Tfp pilus assembly protein PilF
VPRRGYRFDAPLRAAVEPPRLGLAVLPFSCLGGATDASVGLGMADALIGRLARSDALLVRPTLAVARYAAAAPEPREAARELGVDAVLCGTVQRAAGRVRISVQLVARTAALRPWADSFDAEWTDLFAVQDALAERVTEALLPRLSPAARLRRRRAPRPEAHEAYLRGRYLWSRLDPESLAKAFGCFGEAAALDPEYAAPQAGLADAHILLGLAGLSPPPGAWDLALECAGRALDRDPALADAHVARAYARLFRDWDWRAAREGLDEAFALEPGSLAVHAWRGLFFALACETGAARQAIARALEIDPLSGLAAAFRCYLYEIAGEFDQELALAQRAIALGPATLLSHRCLGIAHVRLGHYARGLEALRRAVKLSRDGPGMRAVLAWALARAGDAAGARRLLSELQDLAASGFAFPCLGAAALLELGDADAALERLEEAALTRDAFVVFLGADPSFAPLRAHERFQALLARVASARAAGSA